MAQRWGRPRTMGHASCPRVRIQLRKYIGGKHMKVMLTGATGYIGAQVLEQLLSRGDTVCALVRPETIARREKVEHLQGREGVRIVPGTLDDREALAQAAQGAEVV